MFKIRNKDFLNFLILLIFTLLNIFFLFDKSLLALSEDKELIIDSQEEQKIIKDIEDRFINNNSSIKYQLEDITDYKGSSQEEKNEDNKTIITYFFDDDRPIKKIIEIREKTRSQKIINYIRQYFSDINGQNKIKEEEYDINKKIVRLEDINNNDKIIKRYNWDYGLFSDEIINIPPNTYSYIKTNIQGNIKKTIEKKRTFMYDENNKLKIDYADADSFNQLIEKNLSNHDNNQEYIDEHCKQRHYVFENDQFKIDWSKNNTCDKNIIKNKDGNKNCTKNEFRHFKDEKDLLGNQKIDWPHTMTYDEIITRIQTEPYIVDNVKQRSFKYALDGLNPTIDWSKSTTFDTTIEHKDDQKITTSRHFKDEKDSLGNQKIDWLHSMTYNRIFNKQTRKTTTARKKDFKELFKNISTIDLEPQYLNNKAKVKETIKNKLNKLDINTDELEKILKNIEINKCEKNKVKIHLINDTDQYVQSQDDIILTSIYDVTSHPQNNLSENLSNENNNLSLNNNNSQEHKYSLWLIIPSIIIIITLVILFIFIKQKDLK